MAQQTCETASLQFLARSAFYDKVKPYSLHHSYTTTLPRTNFIVDNVGGITIHNLREEGDSLCFEENGIAVLEMQSSLAYNDFNDREKVQNIYCKEVANALLTYVNGSAVQVFDFAIRRRDKDWPEIPMENEVTPQPARQVHIDSNENATRDLIRTINPETSEELLSKRFLYVNAWRPLRGPLHDWPLALCDAASVQPKDLMEMDNVLPDNIAAVNYVRQGDGTNVNVVENVLVHRNPLHRWYYLRDQQPSELLVFRQVDSTGKTGVPHGSFFQQPVGSIPTLRRESIEVRALVYFED